MKTMSVCLAVAVLVAVLWSETAAYSTGPPPVSCTSMSPVHNTNARQTSESPYVITFSEPSNGQQYSSYDQVEVTISSPTGASFKGFILQAMTPSGQTAGSFVTPLRGTATMLACNRKAIVHRINRVQTSITAKWRVPYRATGSFIFNATIVENYSRYWSNVTSPALQIASP